MTPREAADILRRRQLAIQADEAFARKVGAVADANGHRDLSSALEMAILSLGDADGTDYCPFCGQ